MSTEASYTLSFVPAETGFDLVTCDSRAPRHPKSACVKSEEWGQIVHSESGPVASAVFRGPSGSTHRTHFCRLSERNKYHVYADKIWKDDGNGYPVTNLHLSWYDADGEGETCIFKGAEAANESTPTENPHLVLAYGDLAFSLEVPSGGRSFSFRRKCGIDVTESCQNDRYFRPALLSTEVVLKEYKPTPSKP